MDAGGGNTQWKNDWLGIFNNETFWNLLQVTTHKQHSSLDIDLITSARSEMTANHVTSGMMHCWLVTPHVSLTNVALQICPFSAIIALPAPHDVTCIHCTWRAEASHPASEYTYRYLYPAWVWEPSCHMAKPGLHACGSARCFQLRDSVAVWQGTQCMQTKSFLATGIVFTGGGRRKGLGQRSPFLYDPWHLWWCEVAYLLWSLAALREIED